MAVKIGNKVLGAKEPAKAEKPKAKDLQRDGRRRSPTRRGYPAKTYARLIQYIGEGDTLAEACARPSMPTPWTVRRRLQTDEVFKDQYDKALAIKFHALTDELPYLAEQALAASQKVTAVDCAAHPG
jgi:hypothetical protein